MSQLGVADWIIIALFLLGTLAIAIYHAIKSNKTTSDYLTGDRQLQLLPASVSLTASLYSSILLLGFPAEHYSYGGMYWLYTIGVALGSIYTILVYVPVFYPLRLTSVNDYLLQRYKSRFVAILGTLQSIVSLTLYTGVVYFGPVTALNVATGLPVWAGIVISGLVTCIYTSIGGIKAVIWTDVFQALLMVISLLAVGIQAVIEVGSIERTWEICERGNRLDFSEFSADPRIRFTFWSLSIGVMFLEGYRYGGSQPSVQRYCSLSSITKARICTTLVIPFVFFMISLTAISGLSMFAYFDDIGCDPVKSKIIGNANQLVPHFVIFVMRKPGFAGVLFAGLISSALSTASSCLNSCAANLWDDVIRHVWPNLSTKRNILTTKASVIFFGIIATAITFAVNEIGGTLAQTIITFYSACSGPTSALLTMGIFIPFINWIGAAAGGFSGFTFAMWMGFGAYSINKQRQYLPSTIANCSAYASNILGDASLYTTQIPVTTLIPPTESTTQEHPLYDFYSLSYLWVSSFSFFVTAAVSIIVSLLSGRMGKEGVNPQTIHPWIRSYFTRKEEKDERNGLSPTLSEKAKIPSYSYDNPAIDNTSDNTLGNPYTSKDNILKATSL